MICSEDSNKYSDIHEKKELQKSIAPNGHAMLIYFIVYTTYTFPPKNAR